MDTPRSNGGLKIKLPKIQFNAPVIITYTLICFVVLMFGYATGGKSTMTVFTCYRTALSDPMMYLRAFTYVFGHKDMSHFFSNFSLIVLVGPMLEEKYGSKKMLIMMAVTALVGGVANLLFFPQTALLGASGIVFLFIVVASCTSFKSGSIPLTLILVVVIYIGQEIVTGITANDSISQLTHILGGACGVFFGLYYNRDGAAAAKTE
ncbi:MAG: rhomboid family intramembrane serine protease [Oscillospiraceae bacterium]|nr:rhomboid family intramembrane serine protease [Oscillospiraceae bacterium]